MEFTYLKYLLTLLFISSFYNFIFGKKSNILTCGLVAYCGNKPVNFEWIKILMLYNMSRGTHASGFCINNEVIKNTVPASKLIATYAEDFKYTQNTQFTVIAHDRQASQGSKENKNLAHPFLFEREGKAKGFIIGMHNGTITNSADICEKYKITHDYTHSDSYFLYKIMAKQPVEATFDPIKDIAGTATLIFFNPIVPNQLFVLRDKDRELFYWKPDEDSIYISSIEESLYAIGAPEKSVVEFDENKMFTINKGQISKEEPLIKKPYYKPYIHNHKKDTYGYSSVQSGGVHKTENDFFRNNKKRTTKSFTGVIYEGIPKAPAQLNNKEHFLKWYNGHYYLGDTLAHGSFLVNDHTGYTLEIFNNSNTYEGYTKYYFIFGNMMFSQVSFSDIKTKINPKKDLTLQEEYKEFLKIDFPRVPYPADREKFWKLVAIGGALRALHLMESPKLDAFVTTYPVGGDNAVDKVRYEDGRVWINEHQYFDGVPESAWQFYIGGYQPAQKWLKDRKGRTLGYEDILHYQRIVVALLETARLMKEVDEVGVV